jgi:hypothetical protein
MHTEAADEVSRRCALLPLRQVHVHFMSALHTLLLDAEVTPAARLKVKVVADA